MDNNNDLEMDIFMGEDSITDNEELDKQIDELKPSEEEDSPEIVASRNQDREVPTPSENVDESEEETPEEDETPADSLYSSLANVLYNEGALPNLDLKKNKIKDIDGLVSAIKTEIEANEYNDLTDSQKRYLDTLKAGLPEKVFEETEKVQYQLEQFTDEFLENEENVDARISVIKDYFLLKGMDEEEAENLTQQQIDLATDIEFSKKAVNTIKEFNKQYLEEEIKKAQEAKQYQIEEFNKLKSTINNTNSIIDGITIDKKDKQEILNVITKPVSTLEDGTQLNTIMELQMKDPVKFQYNLAYMIYLTDGFTNFDKFTTVKKAKSKAVKDFETVLKGSTLDLGEGEELDTDSIDLGDLNFNL